MFDVLNRLKNIEVGHFTRRLKLPHSTLCVENEWDLSNPIFLKEEITILKRRFYPGIDIKLLFVSPLDAVRVHTL